MVAVGGGLGSLLRYAVGRWLPTAPGGFPWSTYLLNLAGCLALGLFMVAVTQVWRPGRLLRPLVAVGFLGGLTTLSSFTVELHGLAQAGDWGLAAAYLVATVVGGLVAMWAGGACARLLAAKEVGRS